jgi:D-alanine transaminase
MPEIAYINEAFIPLEKAFVPINDRGYLFADGIYEVIVTRNGKPFLIKEHLERLQRSADAILLHLPAPLSALTTIIELGIKKAGFSETMVYIQITRGIESRRHNYSARLKANLTMTFRAHPEYDPRTLLKGVTIMTVPEIRWSRCDIKSIALLPNIMMKQKAVENGYQEALFVTKTGLVREATAANIFFIKDEVLHTPPADQHILNGVTRFYILQQANVHAIKLIERDCTLAEILKADEVFITSSTMDILPVIKIDETMIANGQPGPFSKTIKNFFPKRT